MGYIKEAWAKLDKLETLSEEELAAINESLEELDEDLKGYFKNQYMKKFMERMMQGAHAQELKRARSEEEQNKAAFSLMLALAKLDPTFKGKDDQDPEEALKKNPGSYFDWLIRLVNKGTADYDEIINDAHEYTDQLSIFNDLKKRNRLPADKKDIMQFKDLQELMQFIQENATTTVNGQQVEASSFKNDIKDIRKLLTDMECPEIPENIKTWEDVLEYIGESDNWEIWSPKNKQGAYILDQWGRGAGWCVGGSGYRGRQATNMWGYFDHYNQGGAKYVCFQNKNKNAERPTNKYLITLGPKGRKPDTSAGYQFNNANNSTIRDNNFGGDRSAQDDQMAALANFLDENGLTDAMKKAGFTELRALGIIENIERLRNGEPYIYTSGKVPQTYREHIKEMEFIDSDGKKRTISVEGHPEYFEAETVNELMNLENLSKGEPYVYDGTPIKQVFKDAIKKVVFSEDYDVQTPSRNQQTGEREMVTGVKFSVFSGCTNMEECHLPASVLVIQNGAFKGCDKAKVIMPRFPDRPFQYSPNDKQYFIDHLYYDDGQKVFKQQ